MNVTYLGPAQPVNTATPIYMWKPQKKNLSQKKKKRCPSFDWLCWWGHFFAQD